MITEAAQICRIASKVTQLPSARPRTRPRSITAVRLEIRRPGPSRPRRHPRSKPDGLIALARSGLRDGVCRRPKRVGERLIRVLSGVDPVSGGLPCGSIPDIARDVRFTTQCEIGSRRVSKNWQKIPGRRSDEPERAAPKTAPTPFWDPRDSPRAPEWGRDLGGADGVSHGRPTSSRRARTPANWSGCRAVQNNRPGGRPRGRTVPIRPARRSPVPGCPSAHPANHGGRRPAGDLRDADTVPRGGDGRPAGRHGGGVRSERRAGQVDCRRLRDESLAGRRQSASFPRRDLSDGRAVGRVFAQARAGRRPSECRGA